MATARLWINENATKKDGTAAVYAIVHISNKSVKINTGVCVVPDRFDKEKGRVRGNSKTVKDDNLSIDKCLGLINDIFVRYRLQQKKLTADLLLREYNNPTFYLDFYAYMDAKLKERVKHKEISPTSEWHQRVTLNKLKKFKSELHFAEIDRNFIEKFIRWLRVHGSGTNTIQKSLSYFKIYLNMAVRDEIIHSNPFDLVVFRRVKVERVFLTEKELKKLIKYYDMQMFSNTLHRTLRHFLFMCLTGLRISDFMRIRKDNVQENALKFVPYKTRVKKPVQITVPLVEKAKQLIRDENSLFPEVFVTIPEQKYNDQLKDIADMAGINKEITNHSARHTFATLFLEKTNDVATLQKILGHSNIRETMVYVHISTKKITAQMQCFDRLLELQ